VNPDTQRLQLLRQLLRQVGARMAKLELRKKAAVDHEDYDTAKLIKAEMDKLRAGLRFLLTKRALKGEIKRSARGGGGLEGDIQGPT